MYARRSSGLSAFFSFINFITRFDLLRSSCFGLTTSPTPVPDVVNRAHYELSTNCVLAVILFATVLYVKLYAPIFFLVYYARRLLSSEGVVVAIHLLRDFPSPSLLGLLHLLLHTVCLCWPFCGVVLRDVCHNSSVTICVHLFIHFE